MLAAGGEVWVADETALREFPPLRAGWSKRGEPARVLISGRNQRRTILGALHVGTGELVPRCASAAAPTTCWPPSSRWERSGPTVPKLLIWDNAPPHHPHRVRDAAARGRDHARLPALPLAGTDAAGGPVARPESNRGRQPLLPLARRNSTDRALAWLDGMSDADRLRRCGFETSKFDWLPT